MAFHELLQTIAERQRDIAEGPITPHVAPDEIRSYLASRYDFSGPTALDEVIADVEGMMRKWQVQVTHPRYFGLFNPSVDAASIVADTLVALYNPQLASWRTSPAANEIERHTLAWLAGKFGLPPRTIASFTTGGAEANLSAVIAALTYTVPEYGEHGARSLSAAPVIYVSRGAHDSFHKIAHITGIGRRALRIVATDDDLRMDLADLARTVAEDREKGLSPLMVVATAGSTAAGAIDPLSDIARFCAVERLWFHVDAAWGGAAILSPRLSVHLAGIENADSITCDAHKWFSVPMGAGMFFCRHPEAVAAAFRVQTTYMPDQTAGETVDPYATSIQWSRRFIGLKLFLALAARGESGYVAMIERQTLMGDVMRAALSAAGWRIVNRTPLPLLCFDREGLAVSNLLAKLYELQIAWMSQVRLGGGASVVRACITSFRTRPADIEYVVREMTELVEQGVV